jgi:Ricin-type beta-trefoil lectin domain-like
LDNGIFRVRNRQSGKYMQVDGGSTSENAIIEQRSNPAQSAADQWRVVLDHTWHKLINVRSGKCMALSQNSGSDNVSFVQQSCSSSDQQKFGFASLTDPYYAMRTKNGLAVQVRSGSTSEDAAIVQFAWSGASNTQQWTLEPVGTTIKPEVLANAMYTITPRHVSKAVAVDGGSLNDNAAIEQATYSASDDRFHWFVVRSGDKRYNLINRKSGKCLDLQSNGETGRLVQRTCSTSATQLFMMLATGDGHHVLYSHYGNAIEVQGASTSNDAALQQAADSGWSYHRQFALTPVLAGEPHRLTFSHATDDGPCGDYFWYKIAQPNGSPLRSPADSFIQLIFAGGKTTATGSDENPFIAQQVSGNLVAIDPSGHMNGGTSVSSGSCLDTDILYDATGQASGRCCVRYNGLTGKLTKSAWSTATYLCQ